MAKTLMEAVYKKIERFFEDRKWVYVFFFALMALAILLRWQIYKHVSLSLIDSDQPFMWAGAADYAKGLFYEPRFYGQNYNSFFEGLMAVPLIWLGYPVYKALPLASQFIFLFPFFFTSLYLFIKGQHYGSLLALCVLLCLPSAYDIMTSLPRGFVSGLFFSSFFIVSIYKPNNFYYLALNCCLVCLGYFINPNSMVITLPFMVYVFQFHVKNKRFYYLQFCNILLFLLLYYVFDGFYKRHPQYVVYGYQHHFSMNYFIQTISHLDQAFAYVSFFSEGKSFSLLLSLMLLGLALFQFNKKAFIAFLSFLGILFISFFSEKSRDGVEWPWYAYSRLFICVPTIFVLFGALVPIKRSLILVAIILISLAFSAFKYQQFDKNLKRLSDQKLWNGVHLVSIESTLSAIQFYKEQCIKNKVDFLLISNGFWLNTYLNYGGPAIDKDFPNTYETRAERRYWVRDKYDEKVCDRFLFISTLYDFEKRIQGDFEVQKLDEFGLYLIKNNNLKTKQFIDMANKIELAD